MREVINHPKRTSFFPNPRELWHFRFLLLNLVLREIRIRYKQTLLGFGWAIILPLLTTLIFSFVFNRLVDVPSYGVPYFLFALAGFVPWTLFANGMSYASTSIVTNAPIISKSYFPRILAPISKQFSGAMDALVALVMLLVLMLLNGILPNARIIFLPLFILLAMMTALGLGLWFSAVHVRFRDVGLVMPFIVQLWLYITPVAYPSNLLEGTSRVLYGLNPMVSVCEGFRWALFGSDSIYLPTLAVSVITSTLVFLSGIVFFQRLEADFPDYL